MQSWAGTKAEVAHVWIVSLCCIILVDTRQAGDIWLGCSRFELLLEKRIDWHVQKQFYHACYSLSPWHITSQHVKPHAIYMHHITIASTITIKWAAEFIVIFIDSFRSFVKPIVLRNHRVKKIRPKQNKTKQNKTVTLWE